MSSSGDQLELSLGGQGISGERSETVRQTGQVMTENDSSAQAPSQASPSNPPTTEDDIRAIYQRLQAIEARLVEDFSPKIESLIQAFESLAKRAEESIPSSLASEVDQLWSLMHAHLGTLFAHDTTPHSSILRKWWDEVMKPAASGRPLDTVTLSSPSGASVTNSSGSVPSPPPPST